MWPSVLEKFGPDQPAAFKGQDIGPGADLINEQGDIDISFLVVAAADSTVLANHRPLRIAGAGGCATGVCAAGDGRNCRQ